MASRVSTVSPYISRDSRTADGSSIRSPFRSHRAITRIEAAKEMVKEREQEIRTLTRALDRETTPKGQRLILARIQASTNNRQSWLDYLATFERESRAVIVPRKSRKS